MLRSPTSPQGLWIAWTVCALVGAVAAWLVKEGNPGNMGICGACFLRDTAGSLGLFAGDGPRIFRPELVGLVLGAFLLRVVTWSYEGRAGSHAGAKFFLGVWMGIGAMVFLGCPFRMLQRLGGGDVNAVVGLAGFLVGVGVGKWLEHGGYHAGKTDVVGVPAGSPGLLFAFLGLGLFLWERVPFGPGPGVTSGPPHASWNWALGLATFAGVALALTGFCAVSAARQVFTGPRAMLIGAGFLIVGYGVTLGISKGSFVLSDANQPVAHTDQLWNALAMVLVGLTGVLAGGCPVRLIVLSGEGNSDAMVASAGVLLGGALAHPLGLVSIAGQGATPMGRIAVGVGIGVSLAYGLAAIGLGKKGKAKE